MRARSCLWVCEEAAHHIPCTHVFKNSHSARSLSSAGFSGVGSITSRTYEANLFGLVYLLSSAVIFNTMFPVDASTVTNLNAHASHALQMLQALKDGSHEIARRKPHLVWSVQSFNIFQLRNSGMDADDLLASLRNASRATHPASSNVFAGGTASSWLIERLFNHQHLVPVRRPHMSDQVVANLAEHKSSTLSSAYLKVRAWTGASTIGDALCHLLADRISLSHT